MALDVENRGNWLGVYAIIQFCNAKFIAVPRKKWISQSGLYVRKKKPCKRITGGERGNGGQSLHLIGREERIFVLIG